MYSELLTIGIVLINCKGTYIIFCNHTRGRARTDYMGDVRQEGWENRVSVVITRYLSFPNFLEKKMCALI